MSKEVVINMKTSYVEDCEHDEDVIHIWQNVNIKKSFTSKKGVKIELIERPEWGLTLYMNGTIMSCQSDEQDYHEALVHPVMASILPKRVCILGGGEGATAREVLKWDCVHLVDMIDWDEDIINLYKTDYKEWAGGAWDDPRLKVEINDAFQLLKNEKRQYDVIIVDLFEYADYENWDEFVGLIKNWLSDGGGIAMYEGMIPILKKNTINKIQHANEVFNSQNRIAGESVSDKFPHTDADDQYTFIPYSVPIQSFLGSALFYLAIDNKNERLNEPAYSVAQFPEGVNLTMDKLQAYLQLAKF
jgi:hypothetical protein